VNLNFKLGFAGTLARMFIKSKLTLVIAITSILMGVMAVYLTPKEEEPQIIVPMIDIQTMVPGLDAHEIERKVTEPIERAVWGLDGVEYVYSASQPHGSMVTVRFKVGEPIEPSLLKIHHKLMTIRNELPSNSLPSEVKSYSIDDVPFLILTFSSTSMDDYTLRQKIAPLARELSSTPDLNRVELLGGLKRSIRVIVDSQKLRDNGVALGSVAMTLKANNAFYPAGKNWDNKDVLDIDVGGKFNTSSDIENVSIGQRGGRVVRIKDVARVVDGPEERTRSSSLILKNSKIPENAVSVIFAKRKGTNVVTLSKKLLERAQAFSKTLPSDVKLSVLRDYGSTAGDKSNELIEHLLLATLSVTVLIAIVMGFRASLVVAIAIPVTLALTLAVYYFMGYTLNRITLFALIFSIGILVDDAIVVVENIERHLHLDKKSGMIKATLRAVSEVGNPTILATFAVIGAILPMAFVRGMMGPYMKPIPVGASVAMILSLFVAFIVTPWAAVKILKDESHHSNETTSAPKVSALDRLYEKMMSAFLNKKIVSILFGAFTMTLLLGAMSLVYFKNVKVKMLPFDNKEEFQVLIDYPASTTLEQNRLWSIELAQKLAETPEVRKVQIFTGEPAPYSFSGMVKHTFTRRSDYQSDFQILLSEKNERKLGSHAVIESLRPIIRQFADSKNGLSKVLEVPPGPPVLATVVAEIYGPDEKTRKKVAQDIYTIFKSEPSIVDLDYTWRPSRSKKVYLYDYAKGGLLGTNAQMVAQNGALLFSESSMGLLNDVTGPEEVSIDLSVENKQRSSSNPFTNITTPSFESGIVDVGQTLKAPVTVETETLYRKNLKPLSYVMSELSGSEEAPVYGILKLTPQIKYPLQTADVPWDTKAPVVKWDGEWFITYEVFRDLGGAFAVVMVLIYIIVLGWFRSFAVPLIIMAPIPISLIGILPGHVVVGSYFTATSMIGFIAGAGIIVRNSIILVDFIEHQLAEGMDLKEAVISAGVLRFRPMLLTAAAVVVGSSVMLFDPIFQGLAVSLIFGEVAATILSRFAVPILYYWVVGKSRVKYIKELELENI
jgi:multidrug efflux pump subunit AcrB